MVNIYVKRLVVGTMLSMIVVWPAYADTDSASDSNNPQATAPAQNKNKAFQSLVSQIQGQSNSDAQQMPAIPSQPTASEQDAEQNIINKQAFKGLVHSIMPLSPDQIHSLRSDYDKTKRAAAVYPGEAPPKLTSSSIQVDMSPGSTPPVIRLQKGMLTSVVFIDSTGEPWPISNYSFGDTKDFNIQASSNDASKQNVLSMQGLSDYRQTDVEVGLRGLNTPIMLQLVTGQQSTDAQVQVHVPGLGPNASGDFQTLPSAGNPHLLSILDGIPPQGAKPLAVVGSDGEANTACQVWVDGNNMFVRSRMTLLSPGWASTMSSADGTHAYVVAKAPVLLMMLNGQIVHLRLQT